MRRIFYIFIYFIGLFLLLFVTKSTYAIQYDLIAPDGQLQRGQPVTFTINIDTQGVSVTSADIGMTYDTNYLQFVNAQPGDAMTAVTSSDLGNGKMLLTGTNSSGFNGTGTFAQINFNLIAQSAGSTELCAIWAPTPTQQPTATIGPTSTQPTSVQPTLIPQQTRLPTSGADIKSNMSIYSGIILITIAGIFYIFHKKIFYSSHKK